MLFRSGKGAKKLLEDACLLKPENMIDEHRCILKNVVSRKKQVVPAIVGSLQQ